MSAKGVSFAGGFWAVIGLVLVVNTAGDLGALAGHGERRILFIELSRFDLLALVGLWMFGPGWHLRGWLNRWVFVGLNLVCLLVQVVLGLLAPQPMFILLAIVLGLLGGLVALTLWVDRRNEQRNEQRLAERMYQL